MKKPPLNRMASGAWPARFQKRVQVARDGRVGNVGQAELAEQAALLLLGRFAALGERQEAFERQFQRLLAQDLGLERFADQRRAGAEHRDLDALQIRDR